MLLQILNGHLTGIKILIQISTLRDFAAVA